MSTSSKKIVVKSAIAKDLVTRNAARDLFIYLKKLNKEKFVLDFSGVIFMSRSFADEYIIQRSKFRAAELEEINMPEAVTKMLDIVSSVRTASVDTPHIKAHALSI
ncbi:MAG: STAS-like domain-containing protein [Candidatus Micrarchaeales archaeon]|nr:STAS-like domain-containing protein [Candidatus Micrarchaeales archaeon]